LRRNRQRGISLALRRNYSFVGLEIVMVLALADSAESLAVRVNVYAPICRVPTNDRNGPMRAERRAPSVIELICNPGGSTELDQTTTASPRSDPSPPFGEGFELKPFDHSRDANLLKSSVWFTDQSLGG
jgi:hypothetical protein